MSVHDAHREHGDRPSGAVLVIAVAVLGLLALPLVVLGGHAAGLGWVWASVLGISTPSLLLVLVGLALGRRDARSSERQVVVALPQRHSAGELASAA